MKLAKEGKKIFIVAVLFAVTVTIVYNLLKEEKTLPVYTPADINKKLVDKSLQGKKSRHTVSDFQLTDQFGNIVSLAKLDNKIYVTDFFFTTCKSICPKMTTQMKRVSDAFKDEEDVMFVSHTVMPEVDSALTLKKYAAEYGADPDQWIFLTGDKKEIYNLARKSYFAVLDEPSEEGPDFIHTENFVLVDKQKQLRGFYDGTNPKEVNQLIKDIAWLIKKEKRKP